MSKFTNKQNDRKKLNTNIVLFRIADFDIKQMIEQPVDWLVTVKHQNKLHNERQIIRLEQFTCKVK